MRIENCLLRVAISRSLKIQAVWLTGTNSQADYIPQLDCYFTQLTQILFSDNKQNCD